MVGKLLLYKCYKNNYDVTITKENTIFRLKTWNNYYAIVDKILSTSSFSWACSANMIHVEDEKVWEAYIKLSFSHYNPL